ncbi:5-methylthioribose kinase [Deinococcus metalli]|uniref:S-methyl-5-thioribose kinase n=1 Tax=Deinococcus metalli TaxID=1141878 RepID=A0A7W8NTC2_9DEIO|nr:S-methyl-5-thioribose kinase [Deinococcus metalli]MBB5378022.1 5-methylthioribose kinase [Deinococcus metalli]GHF53833.1 methylthioribose kinase [Deinococcus metalli]
MEYRILDLRSVVEYVKSRPEAAARLDVAGPLEAREVSDGNLNAVFRVQEPGGARSVLIKQGLPYLRVAGEAWPLSQERADFEARSLARQHLAAPGLVPEPYWHDPEMAVNAMEDLRAHAVIRAPLIAGVRLESLGETIGAFLAATLYGSSDFALGGVERTRLAAQFGNVELCELTEALVLTEPFYPPPNRNDHLPALQDALDDLQADAGLRRRVAALRHRFMTCGQALLHGDLHTGSVMASPPDAQGHSDIRVIDSEFAFFGPMGFDIGLFLANLLLCAHAQAGHAPDAAERAARLTYLRRQMRACWETFQARFRQQMQGAVSAAWREPGFVGDLLLTVLRDAAGYAGCELIRRTVGFAHVLDYDSLEPEERRAQVGTRNLALGRTLIGSADVLHTYDDLDALAWAGMTEDTP